MAVLKPLCFLWSEVPHSWTMICSLPSAGKHLPSWPLVSGTLLGYLWGRGPTLLGHYLSIMHSTKLLTTRHGPSQGLTHTKPANPQHRLYLPLQNYSFLDLTVNRQLRISKHLQAAVSSLWENSFCFLKCVLAPHGRDIGFHVLCPLAGSGPLGYFGHFL